MQICRVWRMRYILSIHYYPSLAFALDSVAFCCTWRRCGSPCGQKHCKMQKACSGKCSQILVQGEICECQYVPACDLWPRLLNLSVYSMLLIPDRASPDSNAVDVPPMPTAKNLALILVLK